MPSATTTREAPLINNPNISIRTSVVILRQSDQDHHYSHTSGSCDYQQKQERPFIHQIISPCVHNHNARQNILLKKRIFLNNTGSNNWFVKKSGQIKNQFPQRFIPQRMLSRRMTHRSYVLHAIATLPSNHNLQLVKKNQTRITGMDNQILSLYARGMPPVR